MTRWRLAGRQLGTLAGLAGLCVLLWILTPHFVTVSNLLNVLEQTSINAIVAVGMTFVIISGGIDLSVGSVVALAGVVLAKWLASRADVFLFDEPTRGIDVAARRDIYDLMSRLVDGGAAILMISSDLPEVLGMSDRVMVMRAGRVQATFDAGGTDEQVLQAALGVAS